ncbi:PucR family transcriptional regulator [Gordonia sp. PDNC005]|uniref:PucR family transcriptional regulator n=1 Tax=unclassified Gordonia (in: high G+C Gram-positive bacteria) TaxID=2657482 RepID=UPI001963592F|nr:PucR family transcriptional regulator [Gordonia sp. PDNC005]QRY61336.1 PucR family transcriptional regulator [Gordonia sp. PDNC005]
MALTVADILALPVVRAGDPELLVDAGLDRVVRWVHVGESPAVAELLTGGELILTTGGPLTTDPHRFCTALATSGVSGLIVELGPGLPQIPEPAIRVAAEVGFPLVALHREVRFVALTEHVHRVIVSEQFHEVEFARHAHQVFTELSMRRADAEEIVGSAAELLSTPVVLEDSAHHVLALAEHGHTAAELLTGWAGRARTDGVGLAVGADGVVFARIVAPLAEPSARVSTVLERAAQALALREMIERDRAALEQQAQHGLLDDLRSARVPDEAGASARARTLGLRVARYYVPVSVGVDIEVGSDEISTRRRKVQVHDGFRHALGLARLTAISTVTGTGLNAVIACTGSDPNAAIDKAGRLVIAEVGRVRGVRAVHVGAGPVAGRIVDAVAGLTEAEHVSAVVAAMSSGAPRVYRVADTRLRGLAAMLADDPRASAFARAELRPLLAAPDAAEMIDLLRTFLEAAGNKTEIARRLHLSRPTLYARIAELRERLGVDLDDGESRASLHAALLILDVARMSTST